MSWVNVTGHYLRAREEERAKRACLRAEAASAALLTAATLLRRHGATEIHLFGSLARGDFREHSDIDIAVKGIDDASYFGVLAEVMRCVGAPVDLVRLEDAPESLRERVRIEGRRL